MFKMADKKKIAALVATNLIAFNSYRMHINCLILLRSLQENYHKQLVINYVLQKRNYHLKKQKLKFLRKVTKQPRSCWFKPGRTGKWWENMINGVCPNSFWVKNFRMSRESFMNLVEELELFIAPDPRTPNYRALTAEKKLAITLYYLKDTGTLNMTANCFGVAVNTVSLVINEVCNAITCQLGPKYLYLPKTEDEMRKKVAEFESKFGMIQAFGCVDGTHIPISCPVENSQDYFCYKQFYSINVQAVCDSKGIFMDVECVWPGSVHDSKVFANSNINKKLRNGSLPGTFQSVLDGCGKIGNYIIGDPAYPMTPFCIKEYQTCSNNSEVIFNSMLRSARNPIECAFGRLKARWAVLTRKLDFKLESIPTIIYATFVLHNFCEKNRIIIDTESVNAQVEHIRENENTHKNQPNPIYSCNTAEGEITRKLLTTYISECLPN